jgi:hypothetical protein
LPAKTQNALTFNFYREPTLNAPLTMTTLLELGQLFQVSDIAQFSFRKYLAKLANLNNLILRAPRKIALDADRVRL